MQIAGFEVDDSLLFASNILRACVKPDITHVCAIKANFSIL